MNQHAKAQETRPQTLQDHIGPLVYTSPAEQEKTIRESVTHNGYSVQQNDPLICNWEVPIPEGLRQIHMTHNRSLLIWDPEVGAIQDLSFDVSRGLQEQDEKRLIELMQQGWGEVSSGSAPDTGYVHHYLYRPHEPSVQE